MRKTIFSALLGLAALVGTAFADFDPTVRLIPCEGSHVMVMPGIQFDFTIIYTNTNELFVHAYDEYGDNEVPISDYNKNQHDERSVIYGDVINEYGIEKEYTVRAYNREMRVAIAKITFETFPDLHNK